MRKRPYGLILTLGIVATTAAAPQARAGCPGGRDVSPTVKTIRACCLAGEPKWLKAKVGFYRPIPEGTRVVFYLDGVPYEATFQKKKRAKLRLDPFGGAREMRVADATLRLEHSSCE